MNVKDTAIELYECIQSHISIRQIADIIEKHDLDDYIIFIRTRHNTFLRGSTLGKTTTQLSQLLMNAADDMGKSVEELLEEIKVSIYKQKLLRVKLQEIAEDFSLSPEERQEAIRKAYKECEYTEEEIDNLS